MKVGIDASNLRQGGGLTHLIALLTHTNPVAHGIDKVIIWCNSHLGQALPQASWIECVIIEKFDRSFWYRAYWQRFVLHRLVKKQCDILFVPGGNFQGNFKPFVAMFQNLLPFSPQEWTPYFPSVRFLRLCLLHYFQKRTFKKASGVICLSDYAKNVLEKNVAGLSKKCVKIAHGIAPAFFHTKNEHRTIETCTKNSPFTLLYVSTISHYKHHTELVRAVAQLRSRGFFIQLELVGPALPNALLTLKKTMSEVDPEGQYILYTPWVAHHDLVDYYHRADAFVFSSSCENLPLILLEAMACGLPIACSDRGVMPEIVKDAGLYYNPQDSHSIEETLTRLLTHKKIREKLSTLAVSYAAHYTWEASANSTFHFLAQVAAEHRARS